MWLVVGGPLSGMDCRIALIPHALAQSVAPINDALARDWPQAQRMNLLDDSLSADLAAGVGAPDDAMTARFIALADYAAGTAADAILFTCSAFGPCIEAAARRHASIPVLKPNEAMIDEAVAGGRRIGLLATFAPTLASMPREFPPGAALEARSATPPGPGSHAESRRTRACSAASSRRAARSRRSPHAACGARRYRPHAGARLAIQGLPSRCSCG